MSSLKELQDLTSKAIKEAQEGLGLGYADAKQLVLKGMVQVKVFDPKNEAKQKQQGRMEKFPSVKFTAVAQTDPVSKIYVSTLFTFELF